MDGNGRWAQRRLLPRVAGHKQGVHAVRSLIRAARERGVEVLTVFAFSSENWQRPPDEVSFLMDLLLRALREEVDKLHSNDVRFRVVGDVGALGRETQQLIDQAQALTASNRGLCLNVAVNYGGRWDIVHAARRAAEAVLRGELRPEAIDEAGLAPYFQLAELPPLDLFIRTGGERRVSNFLLWQLAYAELYFTDTLWPDFDAAAFTRALEDYAARERRFGKTSAQVAAN